MRGGACLRTRPRPSRRKPRLPFRGEDKGFRNGRQNSGPVPKPGGRARLEGLRGTARGIAKLRGTAAACPTGQGPTRSRTFPRGNERRARRGRDIGGPAGGASQDAAKPVAMMFAVRRARIVLGAGDRAAGRKGNRRRRDNKGLQQERIKRDNGERDALCNRGLAKPFHLLMIDRCSRLGNTRTRFFFN